MSKNNPQAIERILVVMTLLMNVLILTSVVGVFWLVQVILSQTSQLNDLIHGFKIV